MTKTEIEFFVGIPSTIPRLLWVLLVFLQLFCVMFHEMKGERKEVGKEVSKIKKFPTFCYINYNTLKKEQEETFKVSRPVYSSLNPITNACI